MQIHQVSGSNVRDALERARDEFGERAVVLSHRSGSHGGVTLAVTESAPASTEALSRMRGQARQLLARSPEVDRAPRPRAGTRDVERTLLATGASQKLVERVCEAVAGRIPEGAHPLDIAGEEVGSVFPVARCRTGAGAVAVLAFLGPAGAGKTTTIAKFAARLVRAGRDVVIATPAGDRPGAAEQMLAYGQHIGCAVHVLQDVESLVASLRRRSRPEVVLVDSTGRLERDVRDVENLTTALAAARVPATIERYLVLPASSSKEAMDNAARRVNADGCVITKLDETARPGRVLEYAVRRKLPIAFLADGPELERHFHRGCPEHFADLMLKGRIS